MTLAELIECFGMPSDLHFGRVRDKRTSRADLHALILLDELAPSDGDIIARTKTETVYIGKEQTLPTIVSTIYLNVDPYVLAAVATPEQVEDLVRCGVDYDEETRSLVLYA